MDTMQILQMRRNTLAAFAGAIIGSGACWFHWGPPNESLGWMP
jgi:hypothetical protein